MAIFTVASQYKGRVTIEHGPMSGCKGFDQSYWANLKDFRSLAKAKNFADSLQVRAVVTPRFNSTILHDNNQPPGDREQLRLIGHGLRKLSAIFGWS